MLLVKAYPSASAIHGLGLFAGEDIRAGTCVWQFGACDFRHAKKDVERWHPQAREWIWQHGYVNPMNADFIVACGDNSIYMNFANPANASLGPTIEGEFTLICNNYIIRGNEITVPFESDDDAHRKMALSKKLSNE